MFPGLLLSANFWTALAFAAVMAWGGIQTLRLKSCHADVEASRAQIASLKSTVEALSADIERQNKAVAAFQQVSAAAKKRALVAQANAESAKLAHAALVAELQRRIATAQKSGTAGGKTCADALAELRSLSR